MTEKKKQQLIKDIAYKIIDLEKRINEKEVNQEPVQLEQIRLEHQLDRAFRAGVIDEVLQLARRSV
ncbi:hypothetical protein ACSHUI_00610 [Bacillus subtilis]|uniref:hypothetical protein n=1 Tax=Bacillus subtilis TaxID=1423 RepID=UPI0025C8C41A|nr:hypothetical protein [Bacillus subtilis]WCS67961.1 hypothetical protein Goe26_00490 [Bacillus phage vB_BsuM-Goe26]GLI90550.1 hypothetical protein ANABIO4_39020 [Bacillus subtilis]